MSSCDPTLDSEGGNMGRKTRVAKSSLAAVFVAAGGAAATQANAAANLGSANVEGVVSSYFGPLGLEDNFVAYVKFQGFSSFSKWWKLTPEGATGGVIAFSAAQKVAPPPGFSGGPGD